MADDTAPTGDAPTKKRVGLPPGSMTAEHRRALAEGRRRGRIVRAYLEALQKSTRGRGRPVTREGLERRIAELGPKIDSAPDALAKLELVQKKIGLQQQLTDMDAPVDISELEAEFITVAKEYGDAKNISVEAWRELKVPRSVLKRAGIV